MERLCEDALERLKHARTTLNAGQAPRRALWRARRAAKRALRDWKTMTRYQLGSVTAAA